jgi:hypothetical protein
MLCLSLFAKSTMVLFHGLSKSFIRNAAFHQSSLHRSQSAIVLSVGRRSRRPASWPWPSRSCLSAAAQKDDSDLPLSIEANVTASRRPYFRVYYNDVYEVILPVGHRFPMEKYGKVRRLLQQWLSDLPQEQQENVDCGTLLSFHVSPHTVPPSLSRRLTRMPYCSSVFFLLDVLKNLLSPLWPP